MTKTKRVQTAANPAHWTGPAIKDALLAERERQGLSVYQLVQKTGGAVGEATVYELFQARRREQVPPLATLTPVLAALGKSVAWLERQLAG